MGIVLTSVAAGAIVGIGSHRAVMLAIAGTGLLMVLVRPLLGLFLLIIVSVLGPFQALPGLSFDAGQLVGGVLVLGTGAFLLIRDGRLRWPNIGTAALILCLAYVIALRYAPTTEALTVVVSLLGLTVTMFAAVQLLDSPTRLEWAIAVLVGCASLVSLTGLVALMLGQDTLSVGPTSVRLFGDWGGTSRTGGLYEQPNVYAQLALLGFLPALAFAMSRDTRNQWVWWIAALFNGIGLLASQSRSAIAAAFLAALIVIPLIRPKLVRLVLVVALSAVSITAIVQLLGFGSSVAERLSPGYQAEEVRVGDPLTQVRTVPAALTTFLRNPLGYGPIGSGTAIGQEVGLAERSAHNVLLGLAVETGIIGLGAGVVLIWKQLRGLWLTIRRRGTELRALRVGLLGACIGTWVHNLAHATIQWLPVWIFFGIVAGATTVVASRQGTYRMS